ncbi:MAG: leucine-rich repeat protein [Prevotella sp.]|nr:leucine-rich repeat protein [Prevotella sp.]
MKNLIKGILLLAILFCAAPIYAYDFCEANEDGVTIYYNVISEKDKTCEVTSKETHDAWGPSYSYDDYVGEINIPSSANGYQVINIGDYALGSCQGITSVTIPNTVTSMGWAPFYYCTSLTSVSLPESLTSISSEAFMGCSGLTSIDIPNSVTAIGANTFKNCTGLTSVTIPNSVTYIGRWAFQDCTAIQSLSLGNSVVTIGELAFQNLPELTSLFIPKSVTSMSYNSFAGCVNLESIIVEDGNEYYNSQNNCNAVIETSTNTLFFGCRNTIIPNTVTHIEQYAFFNRSGLTSITIPNSVKSIGLYAFGSCKDLTSVTFGNSLTSTGRLTFDQCVNLTSITFGNSITSIGEASFQACRKLSTVVIPNTVTEICPYAFGGCYGITSLTLGNSVETIGTTAFGGCWYLKSLVIPKSVKSIGASAFSNALYLTSVTSYITDVFETGSEAFNGCSRATLYVPKGLVDTYRSTPDWNRFTNIKEMITFTPLTIACTDHGKVTINNNTDFTNDIGETNVYDSMTNTFVFTPEEGYQLNRVLLDGLDVTKSVSNNQLTTMIRENSKMMVVFSPKGADVNGDGQVNINDVVMLVNLILGQ